MVLRPTTEDAEFHRGEMRSPLLRETLRPLWFKPDTVVMMKRLGFNWLPRLKALNDSARRPLLWPCGP